MGTPHCMNCGDGFVPNPRVGANQKVCGKEECRQARKRLADQAWRAKNPDYGASRAAKVRAWALAYPHYWRKRRAKSPDYVQRNRDQTRERMRASRLVFAKQDAIQRDPVGYLEALRPLPLFAKQDAMAGSIDGLVTFLAVREAFAKPNDMAPARSAVASSCP
jgi:hypothetical protein